MTLATQLIQFFNDRELTGTITAFVLSAKGAAARDRRYGFCMYLIAVIIASESADGHDSTASVEDIVSALSDEDIHAIAAATMGDYCGDRPADRARHINDRIAGYHAATKAIACNPVAAVDAANTNWLRSNPEATPADAGMFSRSGSRTRVRTTDFAADEF